LENFWVIDECPGALLSFCHFCQVVGLSSCHHHVIIMSSSHHLIISSSHHFIISSSHHHHHHHHHVNIMPLSFASGSSKIKTCHAYNCVDMIVHVASAHRYTKSLFPWSSMIDHYFSIVIVLLLDHLCTLVAMWYSCLYIWRKHNWAAPGASLHHPGWLGKGCRCLSKGTETPTSASQEVWKTRGNPSDMIWLPTALGKFQLASAQQRTPIRQFQVKHSEAFHALRRIGCWQAAAIKASKEAMYLV